jgi:type IV secretory pathway VirB3-like protein
MNMPIGKAMTQSECANCGAVLTGPYCAACGQHAHESARSIDVLFHDAWHVITHVDGRFWQTMLTLLLRPGRLTQEYFAERRARYLPPVRVYLVLSVLFFAFGSIGHHGASESIATLPKGTSTAAVDARQTRPQPNETIKDSGFIFDTVDCDKINSSFKWLENPLRQACKRNAALGGAPVRAAFIANIPKMMFIFLPMMALVMLLVYWRPRRYYVEHLVFFLHAHAAMFLILLLMRPLSWLTTLSAPGFWGGILKLGAGLYAPWYVYRAMRVYYGQSRWLTFTKFLVVGFAYATFLAITLVATLVVSELIA